MIFLSRLAYQGPQKSFLSFKTTDSQLGNGNLEAFESRGREEQGTNLEFKNARQKTC
jgi:hypothetical protein